MQEKICVVGLGYVGLPLVCLLSKHFEVVGYDINKSKIDDLSNGKDETGEVEDLSKYNIQYTADPAIIKAASFIIVAVPTPIDDQNEPDLTFLKDASTTVGQNLSKGSIVVYESTVYPGATEEVCLPILEQESGLKLGEGFQLGYSPERINPGDKVHTIDKIVKIISASDEEGLKRLKDVYGAITEVFKASSIKVAEAAKVIENVQRSLNIALMNELALIFDKVGISTRDVLEAAGTKWNFHKYTPGLVGGHCIGIDPYYLTYKAKELGYDPKIILSGQEVNEKMAGLVANKFKDKKNILVMGLTFKKNVADIRNSKATDLILKLVEQKSKVIAFDPKLDTHVYSLSDFGLPAEVINNKEVILVSQLVGVGGKEKFDGVIVFSPHDEFKEDEYSLENLKKICSDKTLIFDVQGFYDKIEAEQEGFKYLTL